MCGTLRGVTGRSILLTISTAISFGNSVRSIGVGVSVGTVPEPHWVASTVRFEVARAEVGGTDVLPGTGALPGALHDALPGTSALPAGLHDGPDRTLAV